MKPWKLLVLGLAAVSGSFVFASDESANDIENTPVAVLARSYKIQFTTLRDLVFPASDPGEATGWLFQDGQPVDSLNDDQTRRAPWCQVMGLFLEKLNAGDSGIILPETITTEMTKEPSYVTTTSFAGMWKVELDFNCVKYSQVPLTFGELKKTFDGWIKFELVKKQRN